LATELDAAVHGVGGLDDAQILISPSLYAAFLLSAAAHFDTQLIAYVESQRIWTDSPAAILFRPIRKAPGARVEFRRVICAVRVVKAIPQLRELAVAIDDDA